jgi:hypothetical protein
VQSPPPTTFPPPASEGWIGPINADFDAPPSQPLPEGTAVISTGTIASDNVTGARYWIKLPNGTSATVRAFWQGQL